MSITSRFNMVTMVREKCLENDNFSRSGNLVSVREI